MGVTIATTRVALNTVTGNQTITTPDLGGLTPKAAIFIVTFAVTDGAAAAHNVLSFGAATGAANEWVRSVNDENAQDTTDTHRIQSNTRCIQVHTPGGAAVDGEAEFFAFVADGVTINITNAFAAAYLLEVIFFAGTDVSAHANTATLNATVDVATDITDPGFPVELVIAAHTPAQTTEIDNTGGLSMSLGFIHNGTSITQESIHMVSDSGKATSAVKFFETQTYGLMRRRHNSGVFFYGVDFSDFDTVGYSVTPRVGGGANDIFGYLALSFNSKANIFVGLHTTPIVAGNFSDTGPAFQPNFIMMLASLAEAIDTDFLDSRAGSLAISVFDPDDEFCTSVTSEDNAPTSNTQSLSDDIALNVPDHDGTDEYKANFVGFTATGWDKNYTVAPSVAKVNLVLAIGDIVTPPGPDESPVNVDINQDTNSNVNIDPNNELLLC